MTDRMFDVLRIRDPSNLKIIRQGFILGFIGAMSDGQSYLSGQSYLWYVFVRVRLCSYLSGVPSYLSGCVCTCQIMSVPVRCAIIPVGLCLYLSGYVCNCQVVFAPVRCAIIPVGLGLYLSGYVRNCQVVVIPVKCDIIPVRLCL